jgi:hypothetical protein
MMVRAAMLVMVMAIGCVDAPDDVRPVVTIDKASAAASTRAPGEPAPEEVDICALAAQLDPENVCSLMCDPDAMAEQLAANGMASGTCVELLCALPEAQSVTVGVCLPPASP